MSFKLEKSQEPMPGTFDVTPVRIEHAPILAHLMDTAYTGTIDHEGESPEQCLAEMRETIEGKYGPLIAEASFMAMNQSIATSASIITLWKGVPLLAFSMTAPAYQGQGRAGFLIQKSLSALKAAGYRELYLVVTQGNTVAENLYRKIGFDFLGSVLSNREPSISLSLQRVDSSSENLVQEILEDAPTYQLNTEGIGFISKDAGLSTLTALPPNCKAHQKHVFLLREGAAPIGVADVIQGFPDDETSFLGLLLVRESLQRQGLGEHFYRQLETIIVSELGCKKIRLAVVDSNPAAGFWGKMGFVFTGETRPHEGASLKSVKRVMEKALG